MKYIPLYVRGKTEEEIISKISILEEIFGSHLLFYTNKNMYINDTYTRTIYLCIYTSSGNYIEEFDSIEEVFEDVLYDYKRATE